MKRGAESGEFFECSSRVLVISVNVYYFLRDCVL